MFTLYKVEDDKFDQCGLFLDIQDACRMVLQDQTIEAKHKRKSKLHIVPEQVKEYWLCEGEIFDNFHTLNSVCEEPSTAINYLAEAI